jgi:hypothetical protein
MRGKLLIDVKITPTYTSLPFTGKDEHYLFLRGYSSLQLGSFLRLPIASAIYFELLSHPSVNNFSLLAVIYLFLKLIKSYFYVSTAFFMVIKLPCIFSFL